VDLELSADVLFAFQSRSLGDSEGFALSSQKHVCPGLLNKMFIYVD